MASRMMDFSILDNLASNIEMWGDNWGGDDERKDNDSSISHQACDSTTYFDTKPNNHVDELLHGIQEMQAQMVLFESEIQDFKSSSLPRANDFDKNGNGSIEECYHYSENSGFGVFFTPEAMEKLTGIRIISANFIPMASKHSVVTIDNENIPELQPIFSMVICVIDRGVTLKVDVLANHCHGHKQQNQVYRLIVSLLEGPSLFSERSFRLTALKQLVEEAIDTFNQTIQQPSLADFLLKIGYLLSN